MSEKKKKRGGGLYPYAERYGVIDALPNHAL